MREWTEQCKPEVRTYSPGDIWNWFGENGAFIGGAPMCEGYDEGAIVDPARTPFERLYFVAAPVPILALRLRPRAHREKRLHDSMELIGTLADMDDKVNGLVVYTIVGDIDDAYVEADTEVDETEFVNTLSRTHTVTRWV